VTTAGIGGDGGVGSPGAPQPIAQSETKQKKEQNGTRESAGGLGFAFRIFMFRRG
jgi:hypothetical protein